MKACLDRSTFLVLAACLSLGACQAAEDIADGNDGATNESSSNRTVPLPEPPMDRAELLSAVAQAASATAAGVDDSADQRALAGSRFELRIRFGCRGPAPDLGEAIFGWTFNRENRTLRVRAMPTISSGDPIVKQFAGEEFEAAEGFWIPRPWLLESVCPAAAAVRPGPAEAEADTESAERAPEAQTPVDDEQESQAPPPAWPKVGIVQFFSETDSRTRRRGMRPYETVKVLGADQPLSSQGFNLVLSGRLRPLPGQRVIACASRDADNPPDCIVSARIDRVRLERPDTKEILAEWGAS